MRSPTGSISPSGIFIYASFAHRRRRRTTAGSTTCPMRERAYNPGLNMDFYALGMIFLGISTTVGAANFIVTLLRTRAPGMSINRVPILIWGTLTASRRQPPRRPGRQPRLLPAVDGSAVRHAFLRRAQRRPAAAVAASVLDVRPSLGLRDRAAGHGHGLRWPAGLLPPAARRLHAGRARPRWRPWSLGFGVWVHHMFATGLPDLALSFFSGASIIITVPSAVAVFAWIATIWTGRPVITTAFLFFAGMIVLFVIGGVSGFMTGIGAGRLAADRHLFRRRAYPLRADRHQCLSGGRRASISGFRR